MRRAVALATLLSLVVTGTALAAPTQIHPVVQDGETNYYRLVEQQTTLWPVPPDHCTGPVYEGVVCNRTVDPLDGQKCVWDVDDQIKIIWSGTYLKPGQESSWTHCRVGGSHVYGMSQGAGDGMTLSITISLEAGSSKTISTTGDGLCLEGPFVQDVNPINEPIPNSDGGFGTPGSITFSIRNDTNQTQRYNNGLMVSAGSGNEGWQLYEDRWCPSGYWLGNTGEWETDALGVRYGWSVP